MDDILSGEFSKNMMADWANDVNLLTWRAATKKLLKKLRLLPLLYLNKNILTMVF